MKEGQGKLTWENGTKYEGNWVDGKMSGLVNNFF